jgi:hypothetical protein
MRRLKLDWKAVPWTLWVYIATMLVGASFVVATAHGPALVKAGMVAFTLTWAYFLLGGVRWLWLFTLSACVLGLVLELVAGPIHWPGLALNAIGVVVLSLPVTRRPSRPAMRPSRHTSPINRLFIVHPG